MFTLFLVWSCDTPSGSSVQPPPAGGGSQKLIGKLPFNDTIIQYITLNQYMRDVSRYRREATEGIRQRMVGTIKRADQEAFISYTEMSGEDFLSTREPVRSCSFSLHRLKNFIGDIEAATKRYEVDDERTGITWTYAIYDNTQDHVSKEADYRGLHTLYGVASIDTDSGRIMIDAATGNILSEIIKREQFSLKTEEFSIGILPPDPFNLGHLCPPSCGPPPSPIYQSDDRFKTASYLEPVALTNTLVFSPAKGQGPNEIPFHDTTIQYITLNQYMRDVSRYGTEAVAGIQNELNAIVKEGNDRNFQNYAGTSLRNFVAGREPVRSCTFSLHRLKNFIADIEQAAATKKITDDQQIKITWTYALYDNTKAHYQAGGPDYRGLHTLYGVPTVNTDSGWVMFDMLSGDALSQIIEKEDLKPGSEEVPVSILSPDLFNLGHLCPPSCGPPPSPIGLSDELFDAASYLSKE
ncbi:MAG TPA: hypothetical protein DCP28_01890 [Cytophagales bacterium]|nr:hypothetical protein [Cytophagales bacterium]